MVVGQKGGVEALSIKSTSVDGNTFCSTGMYIIAFERPEENLYVKCPGYIHLVFTDPENSWTFIPYFSRSEKGRHDKLD